MVQSLMDEYYSDATRYTSNAFMRARLGEALQTRSVTPNLVGTRQEAEGLLRDGGGTAGTR
jgi:propionate CoA-transferase